jgi:hypothetical protein
MASSALSTYLSQTNPENLNAGMVAYLSNLSEIATV